MLFNNVYLFIINFILYLKEKNIPKLQEEFIKKLEKLVNFAKIKTDKITENQISISIEANKPK